MTAVLTTPIMGSETLESMIGTATVRTERLVIGCACGAWLIGHGVSCFERAAQVKLRAHESCRNTFQNWFAARGWAPRPHQLAVLDHAAAGDSVLLISPTGGGKTLAGFLPSLAELSEPRERRRHPHALRLAAQGAGGGHRPQPRGAGRGRWGCPSPSRPAPATRRMHKRVRQRQKPPDILITTPEQVSLLVADPHAAHLLKDLRTVILDELHAMVTSKRGVLLSLALTRVAAHAPQARSASGSRPRSPIPTPCAPGLRRRASRRRRWSWGSRRAAPHPHPQVGRARAVVGPFLALCHPGNLRRDLKRAKMTLIFVNTRSQAEMVFQSLWEANDDNLPIALHHGSLDVGQRRKVEAAMAEGRLRAVVCTSTLELGIDWGDVDLVIHVGAPKGSSRLLQRIGRSNHRLDLPSEALLVPSNRFEVLECEAALQAARGECSGHGISHGAEARRAGPAYPGPGLRRALPARRTLREVTGAWTYRKLTRADFDKVIDYVATGGYALKAYERYAKLKPQADGSARLAHPRLAMAYRLNIGTIVEDEMLKVRLASVKRRLGKRVVTGGRVLGEMEEWFLSQLSHGRHLPLRGRGAALRRPRRVRRARLARRRRASR